MGFDIPSLPYPKFALQPQISAETLDLHYGKHHMAYVKNLNDLTAGTDWEKKSLEDVIKTADGKIFNNASQVWNHSFYWKSLSPDGGKEPTGNIAEQINKDFGSFDKFKTEFTEVAKGHFGSGWAWVLMGSDGKLKIHQTHDAGSPLR
eukprot:GHVU01147484.1.p1 GENE.GHVU01147484.1~~GHVU01147484.1.p1  ORF type:complete len:148 (-),score=23.28 GHVU01147484.1:553-996(-)